MASGTRSLEVDAVRAALDETLERVAEGGERVLLTREGNPVAVLVPIRDWERLPPDPAWQERFDRVVARLQSRIPPDVSSDEIEADIRQACEEVRKARIARGR